VDLIDDVLGAELFQVKNVTVVSALGRVNSTGWSRPTLLQRIYLQPPANGIQEIDFVASPPSGQVMSVQLPIAAFTEISTQPWLKGIEVISANGSVVADFDNKQTNKKLKNVVLTTRDISKWDIVSFEDSIQPTGGSKLVVDGWSTRVSLEFKKLKHHLVLSISGPSPSDASRCFQQALNAGAVAAVASVYLTGGLALQAAINVLVATLTTCLGQATIQVNNHSEWEYWWT